MRRRFSLLMFLNYATQGSFVPLFTVRLTKLEFSPLEVGWACAMPALAALVAPLVVGQVADRYFPAQRCLAVCALAAGGLLWWLAELTTPLAVSLVNLGLWLVLGPANTLCAALSFAHLPSPERDFGPVRLWGTIGWVSAGWAFGAWLWLEGPEPGHQFADIFRLGSLLALALAAYALLLPHTPPSKRHQAWLAPLAAFRQLRGRAFRVFWTCCFGVCVTLPFFTQLAPLLLARLGIANELLAPLLTLAQSMEVISLSVFPMLLLRLGLGGSMSLGLGAWFLLLAIFTAGNPLWLVIASLGLNGLFICCFLVAGQVFVNSRAQGDIRASAQALFAFINALGLLAGNLLVGWVRDRVEEQFQLTFAVGAGIALAIFVLMALGFREERQKTTLLVP